MKRSVVWLVLALLGAAGCSGNGSGDADVDTDVDTDSDTDTDPVVRLERGDTVFAVNPDSQTFWLSRAGNELLNFGADALQLGRVDRVDDGANYDPYPLEVEDPLFPYTPPRGLRWLSITAVSVAEQSDTVLGFDLSYEGGKNATLRVSLADEGRLQLTLMPAAEGDDIAYFRIRPRIDESEGLYGLGAYLDQVNQRGTKRAMQKEVDANLESGYNEAHVPVPLLIGTRGWGVFVESPYPMVWDVAADDNLVVEATVGTGLASTEGLTFHLFAADHPLDITRQYYEVTGYPILPAAWALGPWLWRDENDDQAQVLSDAAIMRDMDLACNAIWVDRPYASCVNSFDFEAGKFDDAQAMIDELHDLGYRFGLWHTPYLDKDDPDCQALRDEALAKSYFPPTTGILFNGWSDPIDLTNPEAYDWWQALIRRYTDMGVEGFKLDYAEDVVPGLMGARNKWLFHDGSDERTMHGRYQLFYHAVYNETLPADGGFLLCRSGMYGDQQNVSVIWPGDLDATMTYHREQFTNRKGETVTGVGGLPAALIYSLTLGPSGFPFFGSDTGGYRHSPPDKETFTRWFEHTALSSVMQVGTSSNNVAWEFDQPGGFDQEMLDWYSMYVRLHLRLWPYEWTLANNLLTDGRPIQRPLGLQYPELGEHPDFIYMFGDDLLVAPVVDRDARDKQVIFPPGEWIDWWDGSVHAGEATETVAAPLGHLPLYLRRGGIVPMLRPTIDTMAPTTDTARVDSYDTTPGVLYPRVAAGEPSEFTLFDGTRLNQAEVESELTVGVGPGTDFVHGVLFELVAFGAARPASVQDLGGEMAEVADLPALEATEMGWTFDADNGGSLYVKVSAGENQVTIVR